MWHFICGLIRSRFFCRHYYCMSFFMCIPMVSIMDKLFNHSTFFHEQWKYMAIRRSLVKHSFTITRVDTSKKLLKLWHYLLKRLCKKKTIYRPSFITKGSTYDKAKRQKFGNTHKGTRIKSWNRKINLAYKKLRVQRRENGMLLNTPKNTIYKITRIK